MLKAQTFHLGFPYFLEMQITYIVKFKILHFSNKPESFHNVICRWKLITFGRSSPITFFHSSFFIYRIPNLHEIKQIFESKIFNLCRCYSQWYELSEWLYKHTFLSGKVLYIFNEYLCTRPVVSLLIPSFWPHI